MNGTREAAGAEDGMLEMEGDERSEARLLNQTSQFTPRRGVGASTHRSRGRTEDLRLAACVTADMTDLSILCAAQIESKSAGSSMSAGIRLFRSSVVFESGAGVARTDSGLGDGDERREGGAVNLTPGFVYGCLCDVSLKTKKKFRGRGALARHDSYV